MLRLFRFPHKFRRRRARRNRMTTLVSLVALAILLVVPFYVVYKPPAVLIGYFSRRWPDVLWQVDPSRLSSGGREGGGRSRKVVALTIDDAPSVHTRGIMEVLARHDAHATFFVIGSQAEGREDRLRALVREGHELGNHAMHDEASAALPDAELEAQIYEVRAKLLEAYEAEGVAPPPGQFFRPGSGFFTARMRALLDRLGYRIVLGGIYPHDAQVPWWRVNARHVLSLLRPGAIIICHDRREWTVPMLERVIPEIKRRGYDIVTVTELLRRAEEGDEEGDEG